MIWLVVLVNNSLGNWWEYISVVDLTDEIDVWQLMRGQPMHDNFIVQLWIVLCEIKIL